MPWSLPWKELLGKTPIAFRGHMRGRHHDKCTLEYILFDDKETIVSLSELEYDPFSEYPYPPDENARTICIRKDAERWEELFTCEGRKGKFHQTIFECEGNNCPS